MDQPTNVLNMVDHCKREFSYSVDHFRHLTSRILRQRCLLHFRNRSAHAVECHHRKSLYTPTNRPISSNKPALLFYSPTTCIHIECRDFYFCRVLKPKFKILSKLLLKLNGISSFFHQRTCKTSSNGIGPGILTFSCSLSRSYSPIILSILNSPGIKISRSPFKNV